VSLILCLGGPSDGLHVADVGPTAHLLRPQSVGSGREAERVFYVKQLLVGARSRERSLVYAVDGLVGEALAERFERYLRDHGVR